MKYKNRNKASFPIWQYLIGIFIVLSVLVFSFFAVLQVSIQSRQSAKEASSRLAKEYADLEKVDSFAALNHDVRIRYGAYNIIGIDRIVVLKKGETMEKYSRKTLGADMVGYFQVLNGRKTMQAGDTMKVPKVELRPEYRK